MPASREQVRLAHEVLEGRSTEMPRSVAQEIVTQMHGHTMASLPVRVGTPSTRRSPVGPKHFIAGAIKHPGALTAEASRAGESPMTFARGHTAAPGIVGQRARFAMLLNRIRPKGKVRGRIHKSRAAAPAAGNKRPLNPARAVQDVDQNDIGGVGGKRSYAIGGMGGSTGTTGY